MILPSASGAPIQPLLCLLLASGAQAAELPWKPYDEGIAQARQSHRPVMIQVYADWCQECRKLETDLQRSPELQALLTRRFVLIRLNLASDKPVSYQGRMLSEKALAANLQATWPPMLLFYTANGGLIGRKFGYTPPAELEQLLAYVAAKQP